MRFKSLWIAPLLLTALLPPAFASQESVPKSELRVLLVGQDPQDPRVPIPSIATDRTYELVRERTASFEALLKQHFKTVRVVFGADYQPQMSDVVDVTVFDAIVSLENANAPDSSGLQTLGYGRSENLPRDFDRPALMISHVSARIGEDLGLKLDWL